MDSTLTEARSALEKAKDDMTRYYNRDHIPAPTYQPGDKVFLDASDLRTNRPSKKLAHRYLGPSRILRSVGTHAYRLQLPASMSRVHPVFHVVKLLPVPSDPFHRRTQPPPPPVVVGDETHYEVDKILDSRPYRGRLQYLVAWKGYGYEENSWVDANDINAPRLVRDFHRCHPGAPCHICATIFSTIPFRRVESPQPEEGVMSGK